MRLKILFDSKEQIALSVFLRKGKENRALKFIGLNNQGIVYLLYSSIHKHFPIYKALEEISLITLKTSR